MSNNNKKQCWKNSIWRLATLAAIVFLVAHVVALGLVGCNKLDRKTELKDVERYRGKTVILGISLHNVHGKWLRQTEIHGEIKEIDPTRGMVLLLSDSGREFRAPPDVQALQKAASGVYRSQSTGHVIENPDFISLWKVTLPGEMESVNFEWGGLAQWERGAELQFPN